MQLTQCRYHIVFHAQWHFDIEAPGHVEVDKYLEVRTPSESAQYDVKLLLK